MQSHVAYVSCLGSVVCPSETTAFLSSLEHDSGDIADKHFNEMSNRVWRYKHMVAKLERESVVE